MMELRIGVLAFHGAFIEHETSLKEAFKQLEANDRSGYRDVTLTTVLIKRREQFDHLHGLIIPGGESPVMSKFLGRNGFHESLLHWIKGAGPDTPKPLVWGTCAGLILLANDVQQQKDGGQLMIGGLDIRTNRNILMGQRLCFEDKVKLLNSDLRCGVMSDSQDYPGVFINPPTIDDITGGDVEVLAEYNRQGTNVPIAVRQGSLIASSFHPELTKDYRWHEYFIRNILNSLRLE